MLFEENEELTSVLGNAGSEFGPTSLITTSKSALNPFHQIWQIIKKAL